MGEFKEIWATGTEQSMQTLIEQIVRKVRDIRGKNAVVDETPERMRIIWDVNSPAFVIERSPSKFWIRMDLGQGDSSVWNLNLEAFHSEVIEPLKDKIGGVASGIG